MNISTLPLNRTIFVGARSPPIAVHLGKSISTLAAHGDCDRTACTHPIQEKINDDARTIWSEGVHRVCVIYRYQTWATSNGTDELDTHIVTYTLYTMMLRSWANELPFALGCGAGMRVAPACRCLSVRRLMRRIVEPIEEIFL